MANAEKEEFDPPVPIKSFSLRFEWPSESAMRAYRQRAGELGLEEAFLKVNRRVLVRPKTFFKLIESCQKEGC